MNAALQALFSDRIAPNGAPVRENFAHWFGKSKAVDAGGAPLKLFHGTFDDFDCFEQTEDGGYHFGDESAAGCRLAHLAGDEASPDARVLPVYLSILNPKRLEKDPFGADAWQEQIELAKAEGFDGIRYPNSVEIDELDCEGSPTESWVAFEAHQVKSATGNSGLFDRDEPGMTDRLDRDGHRIVSRMAPGKLEFAKWIEDTVAVDAAGAPLLLHHGTDQDFASFAARQGGIFFAPRLETATAYAWSDTGERPGARVVSVYLSLKNPLVVDEAFFEAFIAENPAMVEAAGKAFFHDRGADTLSENFTASEPWARNLVLAEARRRGADGMIIQEDASPEFHMGGEWNLQPAYVVFHPAQIAIVESRPAARILDERETPVVEPERMRA